MVAVSRGMATVGPGVAVDWRYGLASPLLSLLQSDDLDLLATCCQLVRVSEGHHLARDEGAAVVSVLEGAATATCFTPGGHPAIITMLGPGSSWGLPAAFGHPDPATELHALSEVAALVVAGNHLRRLASERPSISHACLAAMAHDLAEQHRTAVVFAHATTFERVVFRLVELATRWGEFDDTNGRGMRVSLPLTQEDLAFWACTSQKSTAKALSQLRLAGIIETGRRHLTILDLPRLRQRDPQLRGDAELQRFLTALH